MEYFVLVIHILMLNIDMLDTRRVSRYVHFWLYLWGYNDLEIAEKMLLDNKNRYRVRLNNRELTIRLDTLPVSEFEKREHKLLHDIKNLVQSAPKNKEEALRYFSQRVISTQIIVEDPIEARKRKENESKQRFRERVEETAFIKRLDEGRFYNPDRPPRKHELPKVRRIQQEFQSVWQLNGWAQ